MKHTVARTPSRLAACLAWTAGLGFGVPAVYGTAYFARHGDVWQFLGFPTYGAGPFEAIGIRTTAPLLAGFTAVCATEVLAGTLMWKRRSAGLWLSLALLPVEAAYWVGFALPLGPPLGVARTIAVVTALQGQSSSVRRQR